MSKTIYHIGHEAGAFSIVGQGIHDTNVNNYNPAYSRCCVLAPVDTDLVLKLPTMVEHGTSAGYWLHFLIKSTFDSFLTGNRKMGIEVTGGGIVSYRLTKDGPLRSRLYGQGTETIVTGIAINAGEMNIANDVLHEVDIHVYTQSGNGRADVYKNRIKIDSVINEGFPHVGIDTVYFSVFSPFCYMALSEIIIANFPTLGMHVKSLPATFNGTYGTANGGYDTINNVVSDATFSVFNAGEKLTVGSSRNLDGTPGKILGVQLNARVNSDELTALKPMIITTDGEFTGTDFLNTEVTLLPCQKLYQLNPITGTAWAGNLADLQYGFAASNKA